MFLKLADPDNLRIDKHWGMATWLSVYYTLSAFLLLGAASAFLYSGLERSMDRGNRDYLRQKMQVLGHLLWQQPFNSPGVEQEVWEEAEVSRRSRSPFLLRVLDGQKRVLMETRGMASKLPVSVFPTAQSTDLPGWHPVRRKDYLLSSATVSPKADSAAPLEIQAALNVDSEQGLLADYRRDIVVVLVCGLAICGALGAVIARRGLRPIADITRAMEGIGVEHLEQRIKARPWPKELISLAGAFDRMLDRLQDAFGRLSQFSADLAHELRNPINNLIGEAQVVLARERTPAEYTKALQSSLEEYGRLARMIDSMLFLARTEQASAAPAMVPLQARAELQAVCDFYQALAEEQGVVLSCEGKARIQADPLLLRRALSNLLSNALKHTHRGGRVTLRVTEGPGATRTLSVIDSGIGIAPEHIPKLGDRFYRVDPSRPDGAGLGLAIVRSIMTLHGGSLTIDSTEGRGTTVSLVFPANPSSGAQKSS